MSEKIYYHNKYLNDDTIPENAKLQTALILSKKTYRKIQEITDKTGFLSCKPNVIEAAINYYHEYVFSGKYDELKEFQKLNSLRSD